MGADQGRHRPICLQTTGEYVPLCHAPEPEDASTKQPTFDTKSPIAIINFPSGPPLALLPPIPLNLVFFSLSLRTYRMRSYRSLCLIPSGGIPTGKQQESWTSQRDMSSPFQLIIGSVFVSKQCSSWFKVSLTRSDDIPSAIALVSSRVFKAGCRSVVSWKHPRHVCKRDDTVIVDVSAV